MQTNNEITLRVNGINYGGWLEAEITLGIERQARDFRLGVTRTWPGASDLPRRIRAGDISEVFIGDDKVLTGYVDATPISYGATSISVGVTGRSKTSDLVDCSAAHNTGQWRNVKIERIASDLAKPYGVKVINEIDTGPSISDHQIDTGETAFESIGRLLALRQLLSTDNANGDLVLINAGSGGKAVTALVYGQNVLQADAALDYKDVFSEYVSKGQRAGNDNDYADSVAGVTASVKNSNASRYRNLIIQQTGNVTTLDCQQRVKYERAYRNARAVETVYTVQGWRQQNGALWLPNMMVPVKDPIIGFDDELLIVEVSYRVGRGGSTCALKVASKDGYIPSPEKTKKDSTKKTGSGGDTWSEVNPI